MAKQKILIVDDEIFNVDYLEQELEDSNCETLVAFNGQEALDKVQSENPDLVLLDIMMPVMDGFEVLKRLKAQPSTRDIPVIVISASNNLPSVVKGIELGAEDYLPKPFEPTILHARISSCLEKKRLRDLQQLYLKSLERELEIGREIQTSFLPTELPQVDGWRIAAFFKAAREVAGDFYDSFLLPDSNLAFVVGDVCGKGVGAALFMTLFRSLIRATSTTDYFSGLKETQALTPAERIQQVIGFTNAYIAETHDDSSMFATVFIGIINLQDGKLTYINCGNDPPLLRKSSGEIINLPPTGPWLGLIPEAQFTVQEISLEQDDLILAFTDGIPDTLNEAGVSFGNQRLRDIFQTGTADPAIMLENITEQLRQFIGSAEQFDDITIMAVKCDSNFT